VIGCHEDCARHALGANGLQDSETVQPRHLDIKKKEMRLVALYRGHGGAAACAFTGDFNLRVALKQRAESLACERLVIYDQRPDFHVTNGIFTVTREPPAGELPIPK